MVKQYFSKIPLDKQGGFVTELSYLYFYNYFYKQRNNAMFIAGKTHEDLEKAMELSSKNTGKIIIVKNENDLVKCHSMVFFITQDSIFILNAGGLVSEEKVKELAEKYKRSVFQFTPFKQEIRNCALASNVVTVFMLKMLKHVAKKMLQKKKLKYEVKEAELQEENKLMQKEKLKHEAKKAKLQKKRS